MKGFSGFGNSPIKQDIFKKKRALREVSGKAVESFFEGGARLFGLRRAFSNVFKPKNNDSATQDKTKTTPKTNNTGKSKKITVTGP